MKQLPEIDYQVLKALAEKTEPIALDQLAAELEIDQAKVAAVCLSRVEASGEIDVAEQVHHELKLGNKGRELAGKGLPERAIIEALHKAGGAAELTELPELTGLEQKEVGQALRWLKQKHWAKQDKRNIELLDGGRAALEKGPGHDEKLVATLSELGTLSDDQLTTHAIDLSLARELLSGRKGLVDEKERKTRKVALSAAGRKLMAEGVVPRREINQLTSELLRTGQWRETDLRPYDVKLEAQRVRAGKEHPLVSIFQKTRRVFFELGFSEIASSYVESSFWDFDALFQPQDHPARDMQDTFYVGRPKEATLPSPELVDRVRRTHEDGGDTGSVGWRYRWDSQLAQRPVLRTHTTAATIRALAQDPKPPRKVFVVGPVFRRETVDYKHLPVFHQVDGVIIDEKATFANLLGTLKAFYQKMGFSRFQFRPAFFPYTEPSVEIFVWLEKKKDWVEMGGAGMFRPEVTEPLGCTTPVLAWGLGLERLAMFSYDLSNISELYRARLTWLKETGLCR
ncbi:MAG: phenylalanine--tRNA ligase subunit alpha [Deltaproteobacteria bacterium]|nr:phenylalanine--tRNA ligase subunit alpha [Deltaproteobacteria bacterium]